MMQHILIWSASLAGGMLAWTWLGYPIVMSWLARARRAPAAAPLPDVAPMVVAILATRDAVGAVIARADDFLRADYPADRLRVVVGMDVSASEELERVRAHIRDPRIVVVAGDAPSGKAGGLNAAVRAAEGADVLVFSDSQQRFAPNAIRRLVERLHADPAIAAVGGALQLPGDAPGARRSPVEWYWAAERVLRAAEARWHSTIGVSGSIYAMWARHWMPMPAHLILDDVWAPMRLVLAGHRVGYALDAHATDARSTTASQEKTRKVRTLTGNFQLMAWLPGLLTPWRNPVWLQFVSHKLLRLATPWLLAVLAISAAALVVRALSPIMLQTLGAVVAAAVAVTLLQPRLRRVATSAVQWGWSLQTAVVQATVNGLRGRWDVWR
jgi:poly-beta-1,6-N-acetyl-D-glucosamine synthase